MRSCPLVVVLPVIWVQCTQVQAGTCLHSLTYSDMGTPFGDLDGSGAVSISDVQCDILVALWELAGAVAPAPGCLAGPVSRADVLCDGNVNVADVLLVVSLALKTPIAPELDANGDSCPDNCAPVSVRRLAAQSSASASSGGGFRLRNAPVQPNLVGWSTDGTYMLRARPVRAIPAPSETATEVSP